MIPLVILFEMKIPLGEVTYYIDTLAYQISPILGRALGEGCAKEDMRKRKETKQNVKENTVRAGLELQFLTTKSDSEV